MAKRRVIGIAVAMARIIGLTMIVLAILSLPPMRFFLGNAGRTFTFISAVVLGLVGLIWLIAVQVFLRFFDQFLSRN